jgi:hypothetical protein
VLCHKAIVEEFSKNFRVVKQIIKSMNPCFCLCSVTCAGNNDPSLRHPLSLAGCGDFEVTCVVVTSGRLVTTSPSKHAKRVFVTRRLDFLLCRSRRTGAKGQGLAWVPEKLVERPEVARSAVCSKNGTGSSSSPSAFALVQCYHVHPTSIQYDYC